jgi:hypothetical protein
MKEHRAVWYGLSWSPVAFGVYVMIRSVVQRVWYSHCGLSNFWREHSFSPGSLIDLICLLQSFVLCKYDHICLLLIYP